MAKPLKSWEGKPILHPIRKLLYSRKFLTAVAGLIITVLTLKSGWDVEIIVAVDGLLAALILSIAYEDGQAARG